MSHATPIPPNPSGPITPFLQNKGGKETRAGTLGWGMAFRTAEEAGSGFW